MFELLVINLNSASIIFCPNRRSSLNDCKLAVKLKPDYTKALSRAASCCFHIEDYEQCIDMCNLLLDESPADKAILKLKSQAVARRVSSTCK